jgi:hypothetical protein
MNPQDITTTQPITPAPIKLGKFQASRMIFSQSWQILKQDKELAWFPVLSAITSLIALAFFAAVIFFTFLKGDIHMLQTMSESQPTGPVGYSILFAYYIVMFCITNYFLAGLYAIVHGRFNGQNLSMSDGIAHANKNFNKIFIWSLISATVGLVLQIIADRSKIIGNIVAGIFGAAWNILTYFSLPSLVIGQRSIKDSFKESASVIRKTWGETIIINFSMGLFFGCIFFLGTALAIGIVILVPISQIFLIVSILYIIFFVTMIIISSTLGAIFKLALYEYAVTGVIPNGFTPEIIHGAIVSKQ